MTNPFDVFLEVFGNAVEMLSRPLFSYLVFIAISLAIILLIARILLRFVDQGSVEHQEEHKDEEQDEEELSEDDETNIDWYISADDFTGWNEEDRQI